MIQDDNTYEANIEQKHTERIHLQKSFGLRNSTSFFSSWNFELISNHCFPIQDLIRANFKISDLSVDFLINFLKSKLSRDDFSTCLRFKLIMVHNCESSSCQPMAGSTNRMCSKLFEADWSLESNGEISPVTRTKSKFSFVSLDNIISNSTIGVPQPEMHPGLP